MDRRSPRTPCSIVGLTFISVVATFQIGACSPRRSRPVPQAAADGAAPVAMGRDDAVVGDRALIPGGTFVMGTNDGFPDEEPAHAVSIREFILDRQEVTVEGFREFVEATDHRTDAERAGWSIVFEVSRKEWQKKSKVNWRVPDSPDQAPPAGEPVTQVSWRDAAAYCAWRGGRLPTEAEYEYAVRSGLSQARYSWGSELRPQGKLLANWWQALPDSGVDPDGYSRRAPVGSFPANAYGVFDLVGNVWEWCQDWYDPRYYSKSSERNPTGAPSGKERVLRGGSWLCREAYCSGFRVAARNHATPDSSTNSIGFRCAFDTSR